MFYALTDIDTYLLRPISGRDPIGILPIWQYRARDLVPHITGASRQLDGFHVLLAALAWWPAFAKIHNQPVKNLTTYFILVEQAFARACNMNDTPWYLPGNRRLVPGVHVYIGLKPENHLLGGQLQNGVWGIYRSAAESAGLIDENNVVTSRLAEEIKSKSKAVERLFPYLIAEMKQQSTEGVKIAERRSHQLVGELSKIIEGYPFARLIAKPFLAPDKPISTMSLVSLMRQRVKFDEFIPESFVLHAKESIPEHAKIFQNIIDCERYIATVESIFDWLCSGESTSIKEAEEKLQINLEVLRVAKERFKLAGKYPSDSLAYKRKIMLENLDLSSMKRLIETVLDMHKSVSDTRHNMQWITINENGRFDISVSRNLSTEDQLNPKTAWRNSYYLDSLFNLTKQFYSAGVTK